VTYRRFLATAAAMCIYRGYLRAILSTKVAQLRSIVGRAFRVLAIIRGKMSKTRHDLANMFNMPCIDCS
jgi:hypothetical protein